MHSLIGQITFQPECPPGQLIMAQSLSKRLGCPAGKTIRLGLGERSTPLRVATFRSARPHLSVNPENARQLLVPHAGAIRISCDGETLRLGPLIGILTTGYNGNPAAPFGARSKLFRRFIQTGSSEKAFLFVFTPEMVDWEQRSISGWYLLRNDRQRWQWIRYTSPLPDVVYERIPTRRSESRKEVQACLLRLRKTEQCEIFNQGFFNKWSVHSILSQQEQTRQWIPEIHLAPSLATMDEMLDKYQMIYLKPSGGSLGLGILRITKPPDGAYLCRFYAKKAILQRFTTLSKLLHQHFHRQPERFRNYVVQQGIALIRHEDRPVDFRVHMHKDRSNTWRVIAIGCKVAGPGCITTHLRTGGQVALTEEILQKIFADKGAAMREEIITASLAIATALEAETTGSLGELGLDVGIDKDGHIWLFEVNAKPGRHIFAHPSLQTAGWHSAKCITDYSLRLANFL